MIKPVKYCMKCKYRAVCRRICSVFVLCTMYDAQNMDFHTMSTAQTTAIARIWRQRSGLRYILWCDTHFMKCIKVDMSVVGCTDRCIWSMLRVAFLQFSSHLTLYYFNSNVRNMPLKVCIEVEVFDAFVDLWSSKFTKYAIVGVSFASIRKFKLKNFQITETSSTAMEAR